MSPVSVPVINSTNGTNDDIEEYYHKQPAEMKIIDYDHFFTPFAKSRAHNYLKTMLDKASSIQGRSFKFSNGCPNPSCFPYEEFSIKLKTGEVLQLKGKQLADALTYPSGSGHQPLVNLLKTYQDRFHGIQDWKRKALTTTSGSQGGLHILLELCVARGDPVIVQSPFFAGVIGILHPFNVEHIEVESGPDGICPQHLANTLRERRERNLPMPKIFYLNPVGSNPTGEIISNETKRELYKIACEYNLLIIEDDPYYLVTFNSEKQKLISFLSMDIENRVVRFDSISKTIGAGLRIGYVTGPKEIIAKIDLTKECASYCPLFSEAIVYETLISMGFEGFMKHVNFVRNFYHGQCKALVKSLDKHLKDVATWNVPEASMFVWLTIKGIDHISDNFINKCVKNRVLVCPGFAFYGKKRLSPCMRLSFSTLEAGEMEEGIQQLACLIKEEIANQKCTNNYHK